MHANFSPNYLTDAKYHQLTILLIDGLDTEVFESWLKEWIYRRQETRPCLLTAEKKLQNKKQVQAFLLQYNDHHVTSPAFSVDWNLPFVSAARSAANDLLKFLWTVHPKYSVKIENNPKQPTSWWPFQSRWEYRRLADVFLGFRSELSLRQNHRHNRVKSENLKEWINLSEPNISLRCAMELRGFTSTASKVP